MLLSGREETATDSGAGDLPVVREERPEQAPSRVLVVPVETDLAPLYLIEALMESQNGGFGRRGGKDTAVVAEFEALNVVPCQQAFHFVLLHDASILESALQRSL